jgi:hypothetical protein
MRRLLKYTFVLAFAVAIGAYIVFGSLSGEDIVPDSAQRDPTTAPFEPPPPAGNVMPASIDEELDYMVAKRLASLEGWRAFVAAHPDGAYADSARAEVARQLGANNAPQGTPAAAPPLAPTDNSEGDKLSRRLASLTTSLQSAAARVEHLVVGEEAPKPASSDVFAGVSTHATAASEPPDPTSSPSTGADRATDATVSNAAVQDGKPADNAARPPAPLADDAQRSSAAPARTDGAAETQLAALASDNVCQRDEERLAQLRSTPSLDEAARFANELGCERLRPQVLSLMESLAPLPPQDASTRTPPGAQVETGTANPASPPADADVVSSASEEACERDKERLVRLGSNPSGDEALRFVKELGCEKLLPELQRLLGSLDFDTPAPRPPADSARSNPLLGQTCASERATLDRLRQEPSAEAGGLFWRDMQCEGLRPQVRLLLESLNVAPESVGSAPALSEPKAGNAASDAPTAIGTDPAVCRQETAELNRIRATPDLGDAKRFASAMTCGALRPQVARLLESFGE